MIRLFLVVEGPTEEGFVRAVLRPHLLTRDVIPEPIIVTTKLDKSGRKVGKGGGSWAKWKRDLQRVLGEQRGAPDARFTTMFDLYGLPSDFPELERHASERDTTRRAELLETAMAKALGADHRFIPYLQRHEFETLVLACLDVLESLLEEDDLVGLAGLRASMGNQDPEDINDGAETAPSKRLLSYIPIYQKTLHGVLATEGVGLRSLRDVCPRFDSWITTLENLAR